MPEPLNAEDANLHVPGSTGCKPWQGVHVWPCPEYSAGSDATIGEGTDA